MQETKRIERLNGRLSKGIVGEAEAYRLLVDNVKDYAIFILDPQGVVTTWNAGAERVKGYQAAEIIGRHFSCFYTEEAVQKGYPEFELAEALKNGRYEDEGWRIRKDGSRFWANAIITPIYSPVGELLGFAKVTRDLTERQKAEQRVGESLKELKDIKLALSESTIVAMTDKSGIITYVNDAFCKISRYSEKELIGQTHRIINSGYHPHEFFVQMWRTISSGKVWKGEIKNRAKDGTFYWVDTTIVPFLDIHGKPYQYVAIRHDITHQKQIEEELRTSLKDNADIKFALDQSTIVAITDKKGDITYVNDAFCRISKYSKEELIGQNHRIINSGYHPHEFFVQMWRTISSGKVWKGEIKNRAKDGTFYWVDTTIVPFLDQGGRPLQYIAVRHDITPQKEIELQLAQAKEAAEDANRKKNQFLANMSHELRTPLNAVISYSQMMAMGIGGILNEKQQKYLESIHVSGKHLLEMVNDILDIAKIEAGKIKLDIQSVEIKPLVNDLQCVLDQMALNKQVKLNFEVAPTLERVTADSSRLKQIFFNLISNAIKFNKKGGQVVVRLYPVNQHAWVGEVEDNGIGIPRDKVQELFTEFYQIDTSTARVHEGVGLGLALTRHLIKLHGGEITVESEEGIGSIFRFQLPFFSKQNEDAL